jgi:ADP-heptose:LPS heptosyltransferase
MLEHLASYLCDPETEIVSLQYSDASEQISQLKQNSGINVTEVKEIDNHNDIDGLAALISACDLVVSIDNATVHLAGALGVDTKVLLPFNSDWRWGCKQSRSYWYRSLQLYHQHRPNEWEEVFVELQKSLQIDK